MAFFVLVLGLLVFPAGPFIRPHPLLWRFVFGERSSVVVAVVVDGGMMIVWPPLTPYLQHR